MTITNLGKPGEMFPRSGPHGAEETDVGNACKDFSIKWFDKIWGKRKKQNF